MASWVTIMLVSLEQIYIMLDFEVQQAKGFGEVPASKAYVLLYEESASCIWGVEEQVEWRYAIFHGLEI